MPTKSDKNDSFQQLYSEQQTFDQKLDLLARAIDTAVSGTALKDLRKWSESQRGIYVDPDVAKAQEALEEAQEKASA